MLPCGRRTIECWFCTHFNINMHAAGHNYSRMRTAVAHVEFYYVKQTPIELLVCKDVIVVNSSLWVICQQSWSGFVSAKIFFLCLHYNCVYMRYVQAKYRHREYHRGNDSMWLSNSVYSGDVIMKMYIFYVKISIYLKYSKIRKLMFTSDYYYNNKYYIALFSEVTQN